MIGISSSASHRIHNPEEIQENVIDLTPLLDVLFILLIFFILTSGISQIYTEIQLPQTDELLDSKKNDQKTVLIEISGEKHYWKINGKLIYDYEEVKRHLLDLHQSSEAQSYILALERTLPVELLLDLLNFFSAQHITNVQIVSEHASKSSH